MRKQNLKDSRSENCCLWRRERNVTGNIGVDSLYKYAKENKLNQQYLRSVRTKLNLYIFKRWSKFVRDVIYMGRLNSIVEVLFDEIRTNSW